MSSWEKRLAIAAFCLMLLSGAIHFFIKYGMENDDPFSVVNHPLEPVALKIHILAAPLLIFILGFLVRSHMQLDAKGKTSPAQTGGLVTAVLFALTASSGYLIQVVTGSGIYKVLVYVHLIGGLSFALSFGVHLLCGRYRCRRTTRSLGEESRLVA